MVSGKRSNTEEFIQKAQKIFGDRYNYDLVIYQDSKTKIKINCLVHGIFNQQPNTHLSGKGCRQCANDKKRFSLEEFIKLANEKHNYTYNYDNVVYVNSYTKIIIACLKHGDFKQLPGDHLRPNGCWECGIEEAIRKNSYTQQEFIDAVNDIHKFKYDYSETIYRSMTQQITIICPFHGNFEKRASSHLEAGCPICSHEKFGSDQTYSLEDFIKLANEKHNHKYNYDKSVYIDSRTVITITCNKHGDFDQMANCHLFGNGCPKCRNKVSKGERKWLDTIGIPEKYRQCILRINGRIIQTDAYNPITHTIYEFNGGFWHGDPREFNANDINSLNYKTFGELYRTTLDREQYIKNAGYSLVVMWSYDWKLASTRSKYKRNNLIK